MTLSAPIFPPVAVDAMGGDNGSAVVVEGVVSAVRKFNCRCIIVGNEDQISRELYRLSALDDDRVVVKHASEVVTMDDAPSAPLRQKQNASMRVAFELVKAGSACAVVSPGNTGAMMATGLMISGVVPGIARPAIASLIPRVGPCPSVILLDSGANVECRADQLIQFALMGSCYARCALGLKSPRVGLLSNGSEPSKGTDIIRSAAQFLSSLSVVNFIGFVEGREIATSKADVVVCDGFVGNVVLKTMEGAVELVFDSIRSCVEKSVRGSIGMWLTKPLFKGLFDEKLDSSSYGGAPLLGLNDVAIVCHGASSERAIMNGIRVAQKFVVDGLVNEIRTSLSNLDLEISSGSQGGIWNRVANRFTRRRNARKVASRQIVTGDKET